MGDKKVKWYDRQRINDSAMSDEQSYINTRIGNTVYRVFDNGVVSGLQVVDDRAIVNQNTYDDYYHTFLDTLGNKVYQIFKATATNLQQVILYLKEMSAGGNIIVSVYPLTTPTNPNSTISETPMGQKTIIASTLLAVFTEITFDFSAVSALATTGSLTVGHYYAISVERDDSSGSVDVAYSTANPYSDGHIVEYSSTTYTARSNWDLYIKINSAAVKVLAGYAFHSGNPIYLSADATKLSLQNTSGTTNYITIKYKETETDQEIQPRTSQLVYSRLEDSYEIFVRTSIGDISSDEEILGSTYNNGTFPLTISDLRTFIATKSDSRFVVLTAENILSGLADLDCVHWNTATSRWEKASFTNYPQGIISDVTIGEITLLGQINTATPITLGTVYMDATGNLTSTETVVKIGFMKYSTQLIVDIDIAPGTSTLTTQDIDAVYKEFDLTDDQERLFLNNIYSKNIVFNTWSTTNNLNTARRGLASSGTQNSAVCFGGTIGAASAITERFDGSTWSNVAPGLNTARFNISGSGIQNAALSFGGQVGLSSSAVTEKFNGLIWTATGGLLGTGRSCSGGTGIQNATLSGGTSVCEKFNGSTWSATGSVDSGRSLGAGSGTQNSALNFGGSIVTYSAVTEKFNNSAWATTGSLNTARQSLAGCGTQKSSMCCGGESLVLGWNTITELFNSSTWTTTSNMNTAKTGLSGTGSNNKSLCMGGEESPGVYSVITEKFNGQIPYNLYGIIKTSDSFIEYKFNENLVYLNDEENGIITSELLFDENTGLTQQERKDIVELGRMDYGDGVWSATGTLNTARYGLAGCGIQNAALSFGGYDFFSVFSDVTEKFTGLSWANSGTLKTARRFLAGSGIQGAALSFGGGTPVAVAVTETFNGTDWSNVVGGNLNKTRVLLAGCGVKNASVSFGGDIGALSVATEKFNGTIWSNKGDLNTGRQALGGCGHQNSALSFGGNSGVMSSIAEKFNGLVWSLVANMNTATQVMGSAGTQRSALSIIGGAVEKFNVFIWTTTSNLNTSRSYLAGAGTQNVALSFGGNDGAASNVTEKFNTETTIPTGIILGTLKHKD